MNEPKVGEKYNPAEIEKKWISRWEEKQTYATPERSSKPKSYVLGMFPYPSGEGLHTGHGRIFTAVDVIGRYQRMKGYDVLMPMGWDAFGLPAENAAIKAHKNPIDMVPHNEVNFKRQMMNLGLSYDWDRAFSTADPAYYKWTQWLFLKLYSIKNDKGERLVYRKEVSINWCPFCKTGLANEEVQADGTHERCGTKVTQKLLPQWCMRITDYADRLLKDLNGLDWPEGILAQQRNWIGKDRGLMINFKTTDGENLPVWTKFWETIFGTTFIVISPEKVLESIGRGKQFFMEVRSYVNEAVNKSEQTRLEGEKEKTGVNTGLVAVNPANGKEVPVYVADYVLANVGTGVVMGVPAHDKRDFDFAIKYGIPLLQVVEYEDETINEAVAKGKKSHEGEGKLVNSGKFDGMDAWGKGKEEMATWMIKEGYASWKINYHLRDWVFSRQRYWGEPFPLVYCPKCGDENGVVPLADDQLPLKLPYLQSYEPTETGQSPLSRVKEWVETTCPNCGGPVRRETDTMPNWAGSCWYFLRFADPNNDKEAWGKKAMADWLPVDWYLGGAEHAVLHLLYARFWTKAFNDLGLLPFSEPFLRLRSVGMVLAADGKKMSKSLGNVINPDDVVAEYGADAVRIYEMFMGPWEQTISWSPRSLIGCRRFVERVYDLVNRDFENKWQASDAKLALELNRVITKIGEDITALKFNTAVAALMKFVNLWSDSKTGLEKADLSSLLLILSPLAPFICEELWHLLGNAGSIHKMTWPEAKEIKEEELTVVVQVNGKTRGTIRMAYELAKVEGEVKNLALADEKINKWVMGQKHRVVFVSGRLINFVI
ncbi:leucine--tRNA ligase [Candidatus Collierbacteria bacterium RIFCSPHIGHO2_02_FULL_49_10]|uniref:Leucine--tRNA ligase n=2 Tax=Candidatus Collieribacteriota TaxID=1752725 RepID=A0A1F5ESD1_9BACT|nr:MAG: leucine--tRNA ligase [Candidatus Collierbacteria bacterium RIFCSPHIGHO2_02_FULL_49_10]